MINSQINTIESWNKQYKSVSSMDRLKKLFNEVDHDKILITSSFGSTSGVLLHLLSKVAPDHPVYFVNTGYLFEETLEYMEKLKREFGLTNIIEVKPNHKKHQFTRENQTYKTNTDFCCFINKVDPIAKLKEGKEVWVSGIFAYQNENRSQLRIFEPKDKMLKFHPIIDMTEDEAKLYMDIYEIPQHKLIYQGYGSIGCTHCTARGDGREGRWLNSEKTECGLHA